MFFPSEGSGCGPGGPGGVRVRPPSLPEDLARKLGREEMREGERRKEEEQDSDEEDDVPQVFPDHDSTMERFRKTLYYGGSCSDDMPDSDRLSLSVTELCVEAFTKAPPQEGSCVDADAHHLDRLDVARAASLTKNTCSSPTSLMLALLYLDRLRNRNPGYLRSVSSTDLFLVSLMVASKYLHDDGEDDEVFSDEWAEAGGMETRDLNKKELEFLDAIDWSIYVTTEEYKMMRSKVEKEIARRQADKRGWATYTDMLVLTNRMTMIKLLECIAECTLKVTAVCATAYAASLMTMLGTVCMLNKTPIGPSSLQASFSTLLSSPSASSTLPASPNMSQDTSPDAIRHFPMLPTSNLAADVAAASIVFASFAAVSNKTVEAEDDLEEDAQGDGHTDGGSTDSSRPINESSSLMDSIGRNLQRSRWNNEFDDTGGDLGATKDENKSGVSPPNHHSTSVLLRPNGGGQDLLQESIKLLELWRVQVASLWQQERRDLQRQCPLLSRLSFFGGVQSSHRDLGLISGLA